MFFIIKYKINVYVNKYLPYSSHFSFSNMTYKSANTTTYCNIIITVVLPFVPVISPLHVLRYHICVFISDGC